MHIRVTAVISRELPRKWTARCPELGTCTCGRSQDDTLENLAEAVTASLEAVEKSGRLEELHRVVEQQTNPFSLCKEELREGEWLTPIDRELAHA